MTFERFGRSYHLRIRSAEQLRSVLDLDEALWVATVAPISRLNCDETFLKLVDFDDNGLVIPCEMREAIEWLFHVLKDRSRLAEACDSVALDAINADDPEGRIIRQSALKMLTRLEATETDEISVAQIRQLKSQVEASPVSEAGVVIPAATDDPGLTTLISDVLGTVGGVPHPSGEQGVNEEKLDAFLAAARALLTWQAAAAIPDGQSSTQIMPLGTKTPTAYAAYTALRDKVDQYFAQCQALALDPKLAEHLGHTAAALEQVDFDSPEAIAALLKESPLAPARPDGVLDLDGPINPYYRQASAALKSQVLQPILGASAKLPRKGWDQVNAAFAAHRAWVEAKAGAEVEPLGEEKLRQYLDGPTPQALRTLAAQSRDTALVLDNIRVVEKLALYHRWLLPLANNFVSFPELYHPSRLAMFERGSLVMDGRWFCLCVDADDRAAHSKVAKASNMFVLYLEARRSGTDQVHRLAVPVTSGSRGNLYVGKRGVFIDIHGSQWDARVVQIIENPVSLTEALVAPFTRLGRFVGGKIESLTSVAEKRMESLAGKAVSGVQTTAQQAASAAAAQSRMAANVSAGRRDMLMGVGIAGAALGSAFAFITKTLSTVTWWKILIGLGGVVLAVILPTVLVAVVKLRRRDLSSILEGSGWAVNARMRLSRGLSRFFTRRPPYPKGARGTPAKRRLVALIVVLLIAAVAAVGIHWLVTHRPRQAGSTPGEKGAATPTPVVAPQETPPPGAPSSGVPPGAAPHKEASNSRGRFRNAFLWPAVAVGRLGREGLLSPAPPAS